MSINNGTTLENHYRIENLLASGGMGEIYVAIDLRLSIQVAVKTILSTHKINSKFIQLFRGEAKRQAQLQHTAIPQIRDFFTFQNQYCIVMDFIEGTDLEEKVKNSKNSFEVEKVLDWADQILDALEYIHSKDVVHRDIKPSNLKLTPNNLVKLLDFGIAKGTIGDMTIIDTKTVVAASAPYASIEQGIKRKDWYEDISAVSDFHKEKAEELIKLKSEPTEDIFSLGATLYYILTNTLPLQSNRRAIGFWNNRPDGLKPINELNPKVPREVSEVIMQSLALFRKDRLQTATEMRQLLRNAKHIHLHQKQEKLRQQEVDKVAQEINTKWNNQLKSLLQDKENNRIQEIKKYEIQIDELKQLYIEQKNNLEIENSKRKSVEIEISYLLQESEEFKTKIVDLENQLEQTKIRLAETQNQLDKSISKSEKQEVEIKKLLSEVNNSSRKDEIKKYTLEIKELTQIINEQKNLIEIEKAKYKNALSKQFEAQDEIGNKEQILAEMQRKNKSISAKLNQAGRQLASIENDLKRKEYETIRLKRTSQPKKVYLVVGFIIGAVSIFSVGSLLMYFLRVFPPTTNTANYNIDKNQNSISNKTPVSTPTPTPTPTPKSTPTPKYQIAEIPAGVESIKLFESGETVIDDIDYETKFVSSKTRYVWIELNFIHPTFDSSKNIEIKIEWHNGNKILNSHKETFVINPQTSRTSFQTGFGSKGYGSFSAGNYEVVIRYGDQIIANKTFQVVN